jgi:hypothetical protein
MPADPDQLNALEAAAAEHNGVRVWSIVAPTQQELAERVALILGEHMTNDDELHITHSVVQNGSQNKVQQRFLRQPEAYTELFFEYSAVLVLRGATDT